MMKTKLIKGYEKKENKMIDFQENYIYLHEGD